MSHHVRLTREARADLRRLNDFLLQHDLLPARRARETIAKGLQLLQDFPFAGRKANEVDPTLRELVIPLGSAGYVALFRIVDNATVSILAVRHQREDDYH